MSRTIIIHVNENLILDFPTTYKKHLSPQNTHIYQTDAGSFHFRKYLSTWEKPRVNWQCPSNEKRKCTKYNII